MTSQRPKPSFLHALPLDRIEGGASKREKQERWWGVVRCLADIYYFESMVESVLKEKERAKQMRALLHRPANENREEEGARMMIPQSLSEFDEREEELADKLRASLRGLVQLGVWYDLLPFESQVEQENDKGRDREHEHGHGREGKRKKPVPTMTSNRGKDKVRPWMEYGWHSGGDRILRIEGFSWVAREVKRVSSERLGEVYRNAINHRRIIGDDVQKRLMESVFQKVPEAYLLKLLETVGERNGYYLCNRGWQRVGDKFGRTALVKRALKRSIDVDSEKRAGTLRKGIGEFRREISKLNVELEQWRERRRKTREALAEKEAGIKSLTTELGESVVPVTYVLTCWEEEILEAVDKIVQKEMECSTDCA